jgi:hypothetical protein
VIFEPELSRIIPYLLLVSVIGIFTLTSLRKLMILDWKVCKGGIRGGGVLDADCLTTPINQSSG